MILERELPSLDGPGHDGEGDTRRHGSGNYRVWPDCLEDDGTVEVHYALGMRTAFRVE